MISRLPLWQTWTILLASSSLCKQWWTQFQPSLQKHNSLKWHNHNHKMGKGSFSAALEKKLNSCFRHKPSRFRRWLFAPLSDRCLWGGVWEDQEHYMQRNNTWAICTVCVLFGQWSICSLTPKSNFQNSQKACNAQGLRAMPPLPPECNSKALNLNFRQMKLTWRLQTWWCQSFWRGST